MQPQTPEDIYDAVAEMLDDAAPWPTRRRRLPWTPRSSEVGRTFGLGSGLSIPILVDDGNAGVAVEPPSVGGCRGTLSDTFDNKQLETFWRPVRGEFNDSPGTAGRGLIAGPMDPSDDQAFLVTPCSFGDGLSQAYIVSPANGITGVLIRGSVDENNRVSGYGVEYGFSGWVIVRFDAGVPTVLAFPLPEDNPEPVPYQQIRIRAEGSTLYGDIGGVTVMQATDATYTEGVAGVYAGYSTGPVLRDFYTEH